MGCTPFPHDRRHIVDLGQEYQLLGPGNSSYVDRSFQVPTAQSSTVMLN